MRRLLPPRLFLVCVATSVVVGIGVPVVGPAPGPIRLIAALATGPGLWLVSDNARRFARAGANIVTTDDPTAFVREGAFGWTRNPMYLGFLLVCAGVAGAIGTATAAIGPLVFFAAADRWYIPFEERRMVAVFADEYLQYRSVVRRWIGRRPAVPT